MASRGDRIRCTVMFDNRQERNGQIQVPVVFTLNGRKIVILDQDEPEVFMDYDQQLFPYIGMNFGCSVVAMVRTHSVVTKQSNAVTSNEVTRKRVTG